MAAKNMVPDTVWDEQAVLYGLGLRHGNQIAMELGVSPQTVSREMKKRGVVKGSRVDESIEDLIALMDRKAPRAVLMDLSDSQRRRRVAEANAKAVGNMVALLLAADKRGELALVGPVSSAWQWHALGSERGHRGDHFV